MMKKIFCIAASVIVLSGCSSINAVASKAGVNFWSKGAVKTPCKVASSRGDVICIGVPLGEPDKEEVIILRGRYLS